MTTAREVCELLAIVPFDEARSAVAARYEVPLWPPAHALDGLDDRRQRALAFLLAQKLARLADAGHGAGRGSDAVWAVWPASGEAPTHGTVLGPDVCYAGRLAVDAVARARERLAGPRPPGATWAVARAATLTVSLWRVLQRVAEPAAAAFARQLEELLAAVRLPRDALQLAADEGLDAQRFPHLEAADCRVLGLPLLDVWSSAARPDGRREYVGGAEADELLPSSVAAGEGGGSLAVVRPLPELPASADGSFAGLLEAVHKRWQAEAQRLRRGPAQLRALLGAERALSGVASATSEAARRAALERALGRARGSPELQREAHALALLGAPAARWPRPGGPEEAGRACPHRVWRAMVEVLPQQ